MLKIVRQHGLFKVADDNGILAQHFSLEVALQEASKADVPVEYYLHAAEVLEPLVPEVHGQVIG